MRPDIEEYLREQGWAFAGVSQPDHKRQWAQMDGDKVKRVALESELEDLALEIVGSPADIDELAEKYSENILANSEDLQDAIADAYKAGWQDRGKSDEQQSAKWSDKDEEILDAMIDIVSNSLYEPLCPREGMLAWLKALRPSKTVLQRLNAIKEE